MKDKTEKIIDQLRRAIKEGKYKPGERFYSNNSLAKEFHLSSITAGIIITILARENLLYRINGKGTFVKGIEDRHSKNILFIHNISHSLSSNEHPYYNYIFGDLNRKVNEAGFIFQPFYVSPKLATDSWQDALPPLLNVLEKGELRACILFCWDPTPWIERLEELAVPFSCLMGSPNLKVPNLVKLDYRDMAYKCVSFFSSRKCHKIAVLPSLNGELKHELHSVPPLSNSNLSFKAYQSLDETVETADGIFINDDYFALNHIMALENYRFPENILVFGSNVTHLPNFLARVKVDPGKMTSALWRLIDIQLKGAKPSINPVKISLGFEPGQFS